MYIVFFFCNETREKIDYECQADRSIGRAKVEIKINKINDCFGKETIQVYKEYSNFSHKLKIITSTKRKMCFEFATIVYCIFYMLHRHKFQRRSRRKLRRQRKWKLRSRHSDRDHLFITRIILRLLLLETQSYICQVIAVTTIYNSNRNKRWISIISKNFSRFSFC